MRGTVEREIQTLKREVRALRIASFCGILFGVLGLLGAAQKWPSATFDQLSVHRLNIVDNDGATRLAISNKENYPPILMHHQEKKFGKRSMSDSPSIVFYNGDGDEMGGWSWGGHRSSDKKFVQYMTLSQDQFEQNDDLVMHFADSDEGREAYLAGMEQADATPTDVLMKQLYAAAARGRTPAEKDALGHAFAQQHFQARQRFFVGYNPDVAKVSLSDKQGNTRLLLVVMPDGTPRLEFLDANGKVTYQIPQATP